MTGKKLSKEEKEELLRLLLSEDEDLWDEMYEQYLNQKEGKPQKPESLKMRLFTEDIGYYIKKARAIHEDAEKGAS